MNYVKAGCFAFDNELHTVFRYRSFGLIFGISKEICSPPAALSHANALPAVCFAVAGRPCHLVHPDVYWPHNTPETAGRNPTSHQGLPDFSKTIFPSPAEGNTLLPAAVSPPQDWATLWVCYTKHANFLWNIRCGPVLEREYQSGHKRYNIWKILFIKAKFSFLFTRIVYKSSV